MRQSDYDKMILDGKAHQNYILQRLIGTPVRESITKRDIQTNNLCPFSKIVRKYIPSFQKCVSIVVPCGQCLRCMHKRQNELIYRIYNHNKMYKYCIYVTLTYNNEHYSNNVDDCRIDVTKFIKRFRKQFNDRTMSYYLVCERGDLRDRLHFHLLIWWNGLANIDYVCNLVRACWYAPCRNLSSFTDLFQDGYLDAKIPCMPIGNVYIDTSVNTSNSASIASYISKYVCDNTKKVMFHSWSHGLGFDILSIDDDLLSKMSFLRFVQYQPKDKLYKISVPKYYLNKIFIKSVRDVWFNDYLLDDYNEQLKQFIKDDKARSDCLDSYKAYEERTINNYKLRCAEKFKKKRLL